MVGERLPIGLLMSILRLVKKQKIQILATRLNDLQNVRDSMTDSQDRLKKHFDAKGSSCIESYMVGDKVLLDDQDLHTNVVYAVFQTKLYSHFIGPFKVVANKGQAYMTRKLRTHTSRVLRWQA